MYNIKTYNKISKCGTDVFDSAKYTVGDEVASPVGAIVRSAALHDTQFDESLLAIARAGAGTNNIPIDRCSEEGIVVFNTPGANANAVKELVVLGLLISSRRVAPAIDWAKTLKGNGAEVEKMVEKGKSAFAGPEIMGKSLGVIGLGAIGVLVANAATHLGMTVYGYDPYLSVESAWNLSRSVIHAKDLKEIYANCDYITIHVPLTPDTKYTVREETIAQMKDGAYLVNTARGALVDEQALYQALVSGKLRGAALDVYRQEPVSRDNPLLALENVVAAPHVSALSHETNYNGSLICAESIIRVARGEKPLYPLW